MRVTMIEASSRRLSLPLAMAAGLLTAFLLQTVAYPALGVEALAPDFILATVVAAALVLDPVPAILVGAGAGLAQDAFAGGLLGLNGFAKTLPAFLVARARRFLRLGSSAGAGLLVMVAVVTESAIHWGLREVTGADPIAPERWVAAALGFPVTVFYAILVQRPFARLSRSDAAARR